MSGEKHPPEADSDQLQRFKDLARDLEADEDEARFEETVRKIAPKTPEPERKPD